MTSSHSARLNIPRQHDPRFRCWVSRQGPWDFYASARNGARFSSLQRTGQLHLQLWHRERVVSLITPSSLTQGRYELWSPSEHVRLCCLHGAVDELVARELVPPCVGLVQHLHEVFVLSALVGVAGERMEPGAH